MTAGPPPKKEPYSVGVEEFPVRLYAVPLLERGYLRFVNIRPETYHGMWLCDVCGERVVMSKQAAAHAEFHGPGPGRRRRPSPTPSSTRRERV